MAVFIVAWIVTLAFSKPAYPAFPWVGEGPGLLAWIKGNATYFFHYAEWVEDGYNKVSFAANLSSYQSAH